MGRREREPRSKRREANRRKGYEFSDEVKQEARRRWHKENPGREDEILEIDHRCPIWFAKKYGIPKEIITSQDNARAMPVDEHRERDHFNEDEIRLYLSTLVRFYGRLFND